MALTLRETTWFSLLILSILTAKKIFNEKKKSIPLFRLLNTLCPSRKCVSLPLFECTNAASRDKFIRKTDGGLIVVCADNRRRGFDNSLEKLENQWRSFCVLMQPLQNRPEVRRNGDLVSQEAWISDALRKSLYYRNCDALKDILIETGDSMKNDGYSHERLFLKDSQLH